MVELRMRDVILYLTKVTNNIILLLHMRRLDRGRGSCGALDGQPREHVVGEEVCEVDFHSASCYGPEPGFQISPASEIATGQQSTLLS